MSRIEFDPDGHHYTLDGRNVPSVTQVIGKTFPKQHFLTPWAAKTAAQYACEHWAELTQCDLDTRLERIKTAHTTMNKAAMQRGTDIHATAQQVVYGKPVTVAAYAAEAEAYARFLDTWDIQPIATESLVASPTLEYAGGADLWATIGRLDGQRAVLDIKSGTGIYPEIALQLSAYRYAELMRYDDGHEATPPDVDAAYCIHIRRLRRNQPDSPVVVDLRPVRAEAEEFRTFCLLLRFADWLKTTPVGKRIDPTAAGAAA